MIEKPPRWERAAGGVGRREGGSGGRLGWVGGGVGGVLVADLFGGHTDKENTGKNERTLASIRGVHVWAAAGSAEQTESERRRFAA